MGKSKSIEEKEKDDAKFREFMHQIETESDEELSRIETEISSTVKKHYEGNGWDHKRFLVIKEVIIKITIVGLWNES